MLVQGVRTAFPNPNLALYRELLLKGTSILFLGDAYPELNAFPSISEAALRTREREKTPDPDASVLQITPDDRNGGEQLARHLISLGHKKIAGIFRFDSLSSRKQYAGVLHALCESSQPFDDRNFLWYDPFAAQAPDAKLLLSFIRIQLASCTAVICQDEAIAGRLILELEKLGLSVPQRISVAAFGGREKYENPAGRITCIACQDVSPWKTAARLLMARINGKPVSSIVQPMALRHGESTGPAYRSHPESFTFS
ncbi:MAG: substrate-binding domain-containing protein [Lachnospiraceae bacterium]|nr:substrate-binding domain-containing protein [Lachnospiraceae bacterium]